MYKIGLQNIQYPEIRNIVDKIQDARYYKYVEKQSSLERIINKIMGLLKLKKRTIKKRYSYEDVFKPKYDKNLDFFHLFNSVSSGKNDWGVTFETVVPLFEEKKLGVFLKGQILIFDNEKDIKKVNKPECKFLIAISECTYNLQIEYLNYFPIYKDNILRKHRYRRSVYQKLQVLQLRRLLAKFFRIILDVLLCLK